jgi:hypothetical protein
MLATAGVPTFLRLATQSMPADHAGVGRCRQQSARVTAERASTPLATPYVAPPTVPGDVRAVPVAVAAVSPLIA